MAGTAVIIGTIVSAATGAYTTYKSAQDRDDAEDQLKKQAKRDAEVLSENAEILKKKQIAAYAASGVRVDVGSPLAVIEESQRKAEEERSAILEGYGNRGDTLSTEASRIRVGGYSGAASTLLSGATSYATSPNFVNPFKSTSGFTDPGTYYKG